MLAEALGTFRMDVPKTMEAPFMRLVGEFIGDDLASWLVERENFVEAQAQSTH